MSTLFQFRNPISSTILLKDGKAGPLSQIVTLESDQPVQAIASIVMALPESPAKAWIRVEPHQKTINAGGSTTFDVFVDVPPGTMPNQAIEFQLALADETNPDDDYSFSPPIRVMTEPVVVKPCLWCKYIPLMVIAGIVLLIIVLVGMWLGLRQDESPRLRLLSDLTVYSEPWTGSSPVGTLLAGAEVPVMQRLGNNYWYQVQLTDDAATGWVYATDTQAQTLGNLYTAPLYRTPTWPPPGMIVPTSTIVPTPGPTLRWVSPLDPIFIPVTQLCCR